jgi:8-oxo-dGTP pyrophosphatase MutT (NUDIX family)
MSEQGEHPGHLYYVAGVTQQAGALGWMQDEGALKFAIVTSRRTGRWVFPKGGIDAGKTPAETAKNEIFEEAGVIGEAGTEPVGSYRTAKIRPPLIWTVEVALYPVEIAQVLPEWQEMNQRERRFVGLEKARELLSQPEMADLAERFAASRLTDVD